MLVQCPNCRTNYRVADSLVTVPNPTFRCSRCKHIFVLGPKKQDTVREAPPPPPPSPKPEEQKEEEQSFFFPAAEKEQGSEGVREEPPPQAPEEHPQAQPMAAAPADQAGPRPETEKTPPDPIIKEEPLRAAAKPRRPLDHRIEKSPRLPERDERDWSLPSDEAPSGQRPLVIPKEEHAPEMGTPSNDSDHEFDQRWQISSSILQDRGSGNPNPQTDRSISTIPYLILFAALILLYSVGVFVQEVRPEMIRGWLKNLPFIGPTVLKNDHLKQAVSLQSLSPGFQTISGQREVFVLAGKVVNNGSVSVREVRIEGIVYNEEGKEVDRQVISVGNALSTKILRDLNTQDISLLQGLSAQKRFEIRPNESENFVIVFLKPSREIKSFSCRVISAEGAD